MDVARSQPRGGTVLGTNMQQTCNKHATIKKRDTQTRHTSQHHRPDTILAINSVRADESNKTGSLSASNPNHPIEGQTIRVSEILALVLLFSEEIDAQLINEATVTCL